MYKKKNKTRELCEQRKEDNQQKKVDKKITLGLFKAVLYSQRVKIKLTDLVGAGIPLNL